MKRRKTPGPAKRADARARDPKQWAVAVHESAHAVIPRVLGLKCGEAEIEGTAEEGFSGCANTYPSAATMQVWAACPRRRHRLIEVAHRARVMACQAGEEAELAILGHCPPRSAEGDLHEIAGMIWCRLATPPFLAFILEHRLRRFTRQLVKRHQAKIERVAEALVERSQLTGEEIDALVAPSQRPE